MLALILLVFACICPCFCLVHGQNMGKVETSISPTVASIEISAESFLRKDGSVMVQSGVDRLSSTP